MKHDSQSDGVTIGNVTGGIHGSIIAGRDVSKASISLGGQPISADKEPTVAEFKRLLEEIQQELTQITTQRDILTGISAGTPASAEGAKKNIQGVAEKMEKAEGLEPEEARSVQENLIEATNLLSLVLDGAKTAAKKMIETSVAVQPLVEKLEPLVEKLGVAALWVAKLWLPG